MIRVIVIFSLRMFFNLFFKVTVKNIENIPKHGGAIICPNHINAWDTVLIPSHIKRVIYFMGKEELYKNKFIGWFLKKLATFPVKRGKADVGAIKTSISLLKKGELLGIYPEGTRNSENKDLKGKNGALVIANATSVPIIPIGISGDLKPGGKVTINIGEPIYFSKKENKDDLDNMTEQLMTKIKKLAGEQ